MPDSHAPNPVRPLSEIDLGLLAIVRSNPEGGYYDPSDGSAIMIMDGEAVTGEDTEADPDEEGWIATGTDDSSDGYRDMSDFAEAVTEPVLADRLERALDGRGAFRRFRDTLSEDDLYPIWARFSEARHEHRIIEWLMNIDACEATEATVGLRARDAAAGRALTEIAEWRRS